MYKERQRLSNESKRKLLDEVALTVEQEEILPQLIITSDYNGICFASLSFWTTEEKDIKRVEVIGEGDKRQIKVVFAGAIQDNFLLLQLTYKESTSCCHPKYAFPSEWHITYK